MPEIKALASGIWLADGASMASSLTVARVGSRFSFGDGYVFVREQLARILALLVEARVADPGGWIEGSRIVDVAWHGERMVDAARRNRLHVAIATLRKLGLRPVLQSKRGAYRIDGSVALIVVD